MRYLLFQQSSLRVEIAGIAADLDATSPGSAHAPTRRRHLR